MTGDGGDGRRLEVSASEFRALFDAVSTWGHWGERIDELAFVFVADNLGEGVAQFLSWARAQGPLGLDPEVGF
jgi:hypothetical protein